MSSWNYNNLARTCRGTTLLEFSDGTVIELYGVIPEFKLDLNNNLDADFSTHSFRTAEFTMNMELTPDARDYFRVYFYGSWWKRVKSRIRALWGELFKIHAK